MERLNTVDYSITMSHETKQSNQSWKSILFIILFSLKAILIGEGNHAILHTYFVYFFAIKCLFEITKQGILSFNKMWMKQVFLRECNCIFRTLCRNDRATSNRPSNRSTDQPSNQQTDMRSPINICWKWFIQLFYIKPHFVTKCK